MLSCEYKEGIPVAIGAELKRRPWAHSLHHFAASLSITHTYHTVSTSGFFRCYKIMEMAWKHGRLEVNVGHVIWLFINRVLSSGNCWEIWIDCRFQVCNRGIFICTCMIPEAWRITSGLHLSESCKKLQVAPGLMLLESSGHLENNLSSISLRWILQYLKVYYWLLPVKV